MDYLTPLSAPALRAAGVPEGWSYGIADIVRFHELDALNHVNNVAYFRWFESLRVFYLRDYVAAGAAPTDMNFVVIANSARYFAPVHLNETYVVAGRTVSYRNSSFKMEYAVFVDGQMRTAGESLMVALAEDGRSKRPLPEALVEGFVTRDGAVKEG